MGARQQSLTAVRDIFVRIVGSTADSVRFAVLGPVRAWRGDVEIDCGPPTQRKVLAPLLVAGGQPVSMSQLVELLWEGTPPASAPNGVHRGIGLLRRQFEPDLPTRQPGQWLVRQHGNYRLNVSAETLDLLRFRDRADGLLLTAIGIRDSARWGCCVAAGDGVGLEFAVAYYEFTLGE